jgi:hypothetical protein
MPGVTSDDGWTATDAYLAGFLLGDDPVLDAALADSRAAGLPDIAVTPNQARSSRCSCG